MGKRNLSTLTKDINRVDAQGKKVLFLQETMQELSENHLFSPNLEINMIDNELALFFDSIKLAAKKVLLPILIKKHKGEEEIYKNLLSKTK